MSAKKKISLKNQLVHNLLDMKNLAIIIPYIIRAELSIFYILISVY